MSGLNVSGCSGCVSSYSEYIGAHDGASHHNRTSSVTPHITNYGLAYSKMLSIQVRACRACTPRGVPRVTESSDDMRRRAGE